MYKSYRWRPVIIPAYLLPQTTLNMLQYQTKTRSLHDPLLHCRIAGGEIAMGFKADGVFLNCMCIAPGVCLRQIKHSLRFSHKHTTLVLQRYPRLHIRIIANDFAS